MLYKIAKMSAEEKVQNPPEFFQSIGEKVEGYASTGNGETEDDGFRPVDEIESLCMNCQENVSFSLKILPSTLLTGPRA